MKFFILAISIIFSSSVFSSSKKEESIDGILKEGTSNEERELYKGQYPEHLKFCFIGLNNKKDHTHSILILNNTHIEFKNGYPLLKNASLDGENDGVGISYVKYTGDRYYYLIPQKILEGDFENLENNEDSYNLLASNYFGNVVISDKKIMKSFRGQMKSSHLSLADVIGRRSIGFHWKIRFKRSLHCLNIPISKSEREILVEEINSKNLSLLNGEKKKEKFSIISNNCTHELIHLLAKISLMKDVKKGIFYTLKKWHIPNPDLVMTDLIYGIKNEKNSNHWRFPGLKIEYLPKFKNREINSLYKDRIDEDLIFRTSFFYKGEHKKRGFSLLENQTSKDWLKKNRNYLLK